MQFVVLDLEWNNTYAKKANGYINEIIEIGAVKLDSELENVDTFSCIIRSQIGKKLRSGQPHDDRAPDYDDWELNGDILVWNDVLDRSVELSSMGIRVDAASLKKQLELTGKTDRMKFDYHKMIADGTLPLTIGGGIGQSRLCMLMMGRAHIGEVQSSIWDKETMQICEANGITIL